MTIISGLEMLGARGQASLGDSSGTDSLDQIRSPMSGWEKLSKSEKSGTINMYVEHSSRMETTMTAQRNF